MVVGESRCTTRCPLPPSPARLLQDILTKGLEMPDLVDEIYIQLCKHLTHNPRPESSVRGWQLLCMCVGTFPPSRDFENFLLNFILEHKDGAGAIGNYARYSLRRLEGILNSGPSGFVPSVEEIQVRWGGQAGRTCPAAMPTLACRPTRRGRQSWRR